MRPTTIDVCLEAQERIPWVVNQTASAEEQRSLYLHLAACADCRREFAQAAALAKQVQRALTGLGESASSWTALAARLADDPGRPSATEQAVALLEATGLPVLVADLLRSALQVAALRPGVSLNLPLIASITTVS